MHLSPSHGSNPLEPADLAVADPQVLSALFEINHALTTLDLKEAAERLVDILSRGHDVVRVVLALHRQEEEDLDLALSTGGGVTRPRVRSVSVPIVLDGRNMGSVGVDVRIRSSGEEPKPETLLRVVGSMIAQAVRLRRLRGASGPLDLSALSLQDRLEAVEKEALTEALSRARGNRAKAARLLGTTERIFNYRVRKHAIDWKRFRSGATIS
jgi:DNA-binding NtrC family response regulator